MLVDRLFRRLHVLPSKSPGEMWPFKREFSLKIQGRSGLTYTEGDRTLTIDSEMLFGAHDMVIYWSSVSAWTQPAGLVLTAADKERIRTNMGKELSGMRIDWR